MAAQQHVRSFAQQYLPLAMQQAQRLGTDPLNILAQWGLETGYGRSIIPGTYNLGNIKAFSGGGVAARDTMLGTTDRYRAYSSPQAAAQDFGSLLGGRRYAGAVASAQTPQQYGAALQRAGYAEDPHYGRKLGGVADTLARYAGDVLQFASGSGSARAGELSPAQRAYMNAAGGPNPPPGAQDAMQGMQGMQQPQGDPWAAFRAQFTDNSGAGGRQPDAVQNAMQGAQDMNADPWAPFRAQVMGQQQGQQPDQQAQQREAPPDVRSIMDEVRQRYSTNPQAQAPAQPAQLPAAAGPAAASAAGAEGVAPAQPARTLGDRWQDFQNWAGNVGAVVSGNADMLPAGAVSAPQWMTQPPPTQPTERGFLGSMANAFGHNVMNPVYGLGQKGLALASAVAPLYGQDVQQGMQQAMQTLNQDITARERFYQADQANSLGTFLGAAGGMLAPALVTGGAAAPGLLGAMGTGAGWALTSPVRGAETAQDVARGAAMQAGVGAALGGAGYGVQRGVARLGESARGVWDTLRQRQAIGTEAGQQAAAQDILTQRATQGADVAQQVAQSKGIATAMGPNMGPQMPGVQPATTSPLIVPESPIPGVQRSLAERTMNPQIAQLHRSVRDSAPGPFVVQEQANAQARNTFTQNIIGDRAQLQDLVRQRSDATQEIFTRARNAIVPVDDQLRAILGTPQGQRAVADAQNLHLTDAATRNLPFFGGTEQAPTITGAALQNIKLAMDGLTHNAMGSDNPALRTVTGRLQDEFMQHVAELNPTYAQANQVFRQMSPRINEMAYLQDVGQKVVDAQGNVQLGRVNTLLDRIAKEQAERGLNAARDVSPQTISALSALRDDLRIADAATNLGRARGSETAQKQVQNYLLANADTLGRGVLHGIENAGMSVGTAAGATVGGPVGAAAGGLLGRSVDQRLAESVAASQAGLLDKLAQQLTEPQSIQQIAQAAMQRQTTAQTAQAAGAAAGRAAGQAATRRASRAGLLGLMGGRLAGG